MELEQLYNLGDNVKIIGYLEGVVLSVRKTSDNYFYTVKTAYDVCEYSQARLSQIKNNNDKKNDEYREG